MSNSTLQAIRDKVRRLSGSINESQLTTADLDDYINTFYELDFPAGLKLWNLHDNYIFYTTPNVDEYTFPANPQLSNPTTPLLDGAGNPLPSFQSINPPIYIDGYQSFYTQSQEEFFRIYPKLEFEQIGPAGDATTGPFAMTMTNLPVMRGEFQVSAVDNNGITRIAIDDGNGNLINGSPPVTDPGGAGFTLGSINYITGVISVTFRDSTNTDVVIPTTSNLTARFVSYQASRPIGVLFYNNTITLRPVPDKVYKVEMEVYRTPTQLIASTDLPEIHQWWQLIALGAARKVLQDRLDNDALASIEPFYQEQMSLVLYRTANQLTPQRVATIYTDQLQYPVGNSPFGGFR